MNSVFGSEYADAYDAIYEDKDYPAECDLLERVFKTYGDGLIKSVMDMGCGTGGHALPLAERGYEVTGIDRSEGMITQARRKAAHLKGTKAIDFTQGDIREINLEREFDAVILMFAVLGYQTEGADLLATLGTARRHLRLDGLLIFDVWFGPAVLHLRPSQRTKTIPTPGGRLLRAASGELDDQHHICTVRLHVRRFEGDLLMGETEEDHRVRYFFPREIESLLGPTGFSLVRLGAFPEFDKEPDETTWNVLCVARASKE